MSAEHQPKSPESREGIPGRYLVASFPELPSQASFNSREQWPLQVTVVRPFTFTGSTRELEQKLDEVAARYTPIRILGEKESMFGPHKNMPVTELSPSELLTRLHQDIEQACLGVGAEFPQTYPEYSPHVSVKPEASLSVGEEATLTSIALIRMSGEERQIVHTVSLGR